MSNLDALRHSIAHLLAAAVMELYPDTKRAIGPAIEHGFYYDFEFKTPITEEDLPKIEKKMRAILPNWKGFEKHMLSAEEAKKEYPNNEFKHELIDEFSQGKKVSFYKSGEFWDLCKGNHIESIKEIKPDAFKLTHLAGAYWRGDSKNKMLTRIYGLAFESKKELKQHLQFLEEAKKRDHRVLGQKLDLFSFDEISPGSPFFHNNGTVIYNELLNFVRTEYKKRGYQEVVTPLIYDKSLWETSGHAKHFGDEMFHVKMDNKDAALKPMNCPSHCVIYKKGFKSYRDLPVRIADFAPLHRNELKGVLGGLTRVRKFSQDDAHIFATPDQIEDEIFALIDFLNYIYKEVFDFEYKIELSTRPEKALGSKQLWDKAEKALEDALKKKKLEYNINEGDGAFYGPKIDFHIKDVLGRSWQLGTIQLDFNLPERFELEYEDANSKKQQPIMIHRALLGSIERFMAILIEHYAGKFPLWLAPQQVRIISVSDKFNKFSEEIETKLKENGIRVHLDTRTESVSKKIREAQLHYVPLMLTIGEKEVESKTLAVRTLDGKVKFGMQVEEFINTVKLQIDSKSNKIEL